MGVGSIGRGEIVEGRGVEGIEEGRGGIEEGRGGVEEGWMSLKDRGDELREGLLYVLSCPRAGFYQRYSHLSCIFLLFS